MRVIIIGSFLILSLIMPASSKAVAFCESNLVAKTLLQASSGSKKRHSRKSSRNSSKSSRNGSNSKNGSNSSKNSSTSTDSEQTEKSSVSSTPASAPKEEVSVGPRGPTRIDFDDRLIQGQGNKSGAVYLFDRKELAIHSMVKQRATFRDQIVKDILTE